MSPEESSKDPRDYFFGEVLRLPPGVREPDHYVLLGLQYFVSDHDEIQRAVMERMRVLDSCEADERPGYPEALAWIRRRVQSAQSTLLDEAKRKAYDARLVGATDKAEPAPTPEHKDFKLVTGRMFADRYRVLKKVRLGGLGRVYEVLDKNLRTRMHLSVLPPSQGADPVVYRRVEQAARAAAALDHPGILAVTEVGEYQGTLYIKTRPPEGRSLFDWIESTPNMRLDGERAQEVTLEMARALAHAHNRGAVHGDLRPNKVFLDRDGRVQVADFCVTRAVGGARSDDPRFRAPEGREAPPADLFALGCVAYQMVTGLPPSADADPEHLAGSLPDDLPPDFRRLILELLAPEPEQRPESASAVVEWLRPVEAPPPRRRGKVFALVGLAIVATVVIAMLTGPRDEESGEAVNVAWARISERDFRGALEGLEQALQEDPDNRLLRPPMAAALDGLAAGHLQNGDPWGALTEYEKAQALQPDRKRGQLILGAREAAKARLKGIWVECPEVVRELEVRIHVGDVPLELIEIDGRRVSVEDGVATLELDATEGPRTVEWLMVDVAQNRLEGRVKTVVDRTPPVIEITTPEEGALLLKGEVEVKVRVADANPPATVSIRERAVSLRNGNARAVLRLPDGEHTIAVQATDLAGQRQERAVTIVVDGSPPELTLERRRAVSSDGKVTVRGRARGRDVLLEVDGEKIELAADGSFEFERTLPEGGAVQVQATGANGLVRRRSMDVIVDRDPPQVELEWKRRDPRGALLYGLREIVEGELRVPLRGVDASGVVLKVSEGRVVEGVWVLEALQGERTVRVTATDEAGNVSEHDIRLEGHRGQPKLTVECDVPAITNLAELELDIDTNRDLKVQGKAAQPGRMKLPLPEGRIQVEVVAHDRYGNETTWMRSVLVDRTPPRLSLKGPAERGPGRQWIEIESDEPLDSLTCVGKTFEVEGETAVRFEAELAASRRSLTAIARDLAGNEAKRQFPLVVRNRVLALDGKGALKLALDTALPELTVECWVRGEKPTGRMVVASNGADQGFALLWSSVDKGPPYGSVQLDGRGFVSVPARKAVKPGAWVHVALVYDGKKLRYFVNGQLQGDEEATQPLAATRLPIFIGAESAPDGSPVSHFVGAIDDLRISDRARYTSSFRPPRLHDADRFTLALFRFDMAPTDGKHADASGRGRDAAAVGPVKLEAETR